MRIAFIGQSAFGEAVLKALAGSEEDEIVGVFLTQGRGGKEDPVAETARQLALPVYQCARFRDAQAISQFEALEPELCVMAFVTDIVPMEMINAPAKGTIQYHPSLLPLHRGPSSINWPIVNGETQTGLSIFWPDEGLDTGPLLIQKTVEIEPNDTLGSLYFGKLFPMGVEAMVEAVELVREGKAPKIVQNEDDATYEGWFKAKEARIDWSRPGGEIYNLIRGSDPQPGANSTLDGETVSFYDASFAPGDSTDAGGSVVSVGEQIGIAVLDGTISVGRVRGADGKVPAADFVEATGLKAGDRFGD
ncbi:MAG: methionyl-tRNA formyltransferase [Gammaproteobacteria bacterium]|nr:methionyl-tRNA formyltransferase [Gammaproteobacteria bacterium]MDH3505744.1 methionyl-tRNA formyltransferase [Gammaproteobacteria bacterium]